MRCLITCGPTYESLDQVRRLTNFSTGKLGIGLANFLHAAGHPVTLLKGCYATCSDPCSVPSISFTTTEDLLNHLRSCVNQQFDAVFHAAAVSDFRFGSVFRRAPDGTLEAVTSGKFSTRDGALLAELVPTPKLITELPALFPSAKIFGWKYEVDGTRPDALARALKQIQEHKTHFSVVNGPAYGDGFGIVNPNGNMRICADAAELYRELLHHGAHPTRRD